MEEVLPDLGAAELARGGGAARAHAEAIMAVLEDERASHAAFRRAMMGERTLVMAVGNDVLAGRGSAVPTGGSGSSAGAYALSPLVTADVVLLCRNLTAMADIFDGSADAAEAMPRTAKLAEAVHRRWYLHLFATIFGGAYERIVEQRFIAIAGQRVARAGLAVAIYAADHGGAMPGSLTEAVGVELWDPLATPGKMRLHYVGQGADARVWSAGRNGKDDGGHDDREPTTLPSRLQPDDDVARFRRRARTVEDLPEEFREENGEAKKAAE